MVFGTTQRLNRNMTGFGPRFFDNSRFNTLSVARITGFAQLSRIFNFYLAGLSHRPMEGTHNPTLGIKTEFRPR